MKELFLELLAYNRLISLAEKNDLDALGMDETDLEANGIDQIDLSELLRDNEGPICLSHLHH